MPDAMRYNTASSLLESHTRMALEFEALVGHLYVVNGRSISMMPPGALVEVAPKKAARGRETDTIFVLVLPSGDTAAPALFYEQMAQLCAERYFSSSGSVTAGIRAALAHLNENLYEHNQLHGAHYEATLLCAVMKGSDLYLARIGSGVALFRSEDEVQPFPAEFSNDEQIFGMPLGVRMSPDVKMAMYQVKEGARLLLADVMLADLNYDVVRASMTRDDIGDVLLALKDAAAGTLTATAIEFVPPEAPSPLPVPVVESTRGEVITPAPEVVVEEARPVTAREEIAPRLSEARGDSLRRAAGSAALSAAGAIDNLNDAVDLVLPEKDSAKKPETGAPLMAALALLIPVVVVLVVVGFWLSGTGQSEFDVCVAQAYQAASLARSIDSSDVRGTLAAWSAVNAVVDRCNTLSPNDPQMAALSAEAQTVTDALVGIDRRPTTVVDTLPSAVLTRLVLQGQDLYALDNGNDIVYRITLNPDGLSVSPGTRQPIAAMRRGGIVNQFTVGDIIDITWAENDAGLQQGSVITALDDQGVLINCPPRFTQQCSAQRLNTSTWVRPTQMQFWQGRLYILDPGANQVWRYDASGGSFPNAPVEYFVGEGRPDIRSAVGFAIDTPGSLYVLLADGALLKYTSGQRVGFAFSNFPEGQSLSSVNRMVMNTNPTDLMLYIVARDLYTIYQTTHAGTRAASYRPSEDRQFAELADVAVDSNNDLVYAASGSTIYALQRDQQ
jgi:hypothetical protein